jgi:integrase
MEVDPIRDAGKIAEMKWILKQKDVRDELLFIVGINTALRIGDLLSLSVGDVLDDDGQITGTICVKEQKTGKTKRVPVNTSIRIALVKYLEQRPVRDRSEPLFHSKKGRPLSRSQAWRILKTAGQFAGLEHIGTHSLRKTFGYHAYKKTGNDIGLVQKLLNHSNLKVTLKYIGIDQEKMDNTYMRLNL